MAEDVAANEGGIGRRRILQAGGLVAAAGALAGCVSGTSTSATSTKAAAAAGQKRTLIWATHVYYNQPALVGISVGFRDFLDMVGWTFKVTAAKTSDNVQETIQAQQEALAEKPDAIVATMTDPTSFNKSLKAIINAGIFLELNNTQPDQGNGLGLPYIGQSFSGAGEAAITMVLDAVVKGGKKSGPVLLGYCCGDQGAVGSRTVGQKAGLAAYNQKNGTHFTTIELLDTSDTDPASAQGTWQAKLQQVKNDIVGMVCDQVGDPSIDAAKAIGLKPGFVPIVTFDVTTERLNFVEDGWFLGVVDQQPYAQGYIAASQAWMKLQTQTNPTLLYDTGSSIITKETRANALKGAAYIAKRAQQLGLAQ